ncbi:MAG: hypothetical protein ACYSUN_10945, partial [Planctomycetota bacterium]
EEDPATNPVEAATGGAEKPAEEQAKDEQEAKKQQDQADLKSEVDGYLNAWFRFRKVGSDQDNDFYGDLYINYTHRGDNIIRARANARVYWDFGGNQQPNDPLRGFWDSFNSDVQARVFEAWVEWDRAKDDKLKVRVGRMYIEEGTYLQFDGAQVDVGLSKWVQGMDFSVLAGVPVLVSERSRSGDWLAGFVLRHRVNPNTRWRFEYYHLSQNFDGINDPITDPINQPVTLPAGRNKDDLFGFSFWHRQGKSLNFFGRFTILQEDPNELHLRGKWQSDDFRWNAIVEWYQIYTRLVNVANEISPFVPMLGSLEPFWRLSVRGTWQDFEHWIVRAGYTRRELHDSRDEGQFNHTYNSYFASGTYLGLAEGKLDLTLITTGYDTNADRSIFVLGGNADWRFAPKWSLNAGIDYSLWKYDFMAALERENVWSAWLEARFRPEKKWSLWSRLLVQEDDFDSWITLIVAAKMRF